MITVICNIPNTPSGPNKKTSPAKVTKTPPAKVTKRTETEDQAIRYNAYQLHSEMNIAFGGRNNNTEPFVDAKRISVFTNLKPKGSNGQAAEAYYKDAIGRKENFSKIVGRNFSEEQFKVYGQFLTAALGIYGGPDKQLSPSELEKALNDTELRYYFKKVRHLTN